MFETLQQMPANYTTQLNIFVFSTGYNPDWSYIYRYHFDLVARVEFFILSDH